VGTARFAIEVRTPFRLDLTVWALRRRAHNTIDAWGGTTYTRTLVVDGTPVLPRALAALGPERLRVNADCGRKTRGDVGAP
jgi:DNA-3-methyladenine glycosylase II